MKIFQVINNQPQVTTECLLIPEFKKLWDRDKSKNKDMAYKEFCYIYFLSDYKSLYLAFEPDIREEMIIKDYIKKDNWKADNDVKAAIVKYKDLQNTPTMRFLQSNIDAMESMSEYFSGIDWDEQGAKGAPKYKITEVSNAVKNAGGIIDNIEKLKEKVAKEQSIGAKQRGGGTGGLLEMDGIN